MDRRHHNAQIKLRPAHLDRYVDLNPTSLMNQVMKCMHTSFPYYLNRGDMV
jgi:hypothetical protein